jgi:hypothetical protein
MRRALFVLTAIFVFARPALAVDISSCNQTVPPENIGRLVNDLDCAGELLAVRLEKNASLDLNGFTIGGGDNIGVSCNERACTIVGPGTIAGNWVAVNLESKVRLSIRHVTILDADVAILGRAIKHDPNHIENYYVTIDNAYNWAISGQRIRAQRLTVTGSAPASIGTVHAHSLKGTNIDISNNHSTGIIAEKVRVENLTANGNEGVGIDAGRVILRGSEVTGNAAGLSGVDILSDSRPKLVDSTCGLSSGNAGGDWDVCTND